MEKLYDLITQSSVGPSRVTIEVLLRRADNLAATLASYQDILRPDYLNGKLFIENGTLIVALLHTQWLYHMGRPNPYNHQSNSYSYIHTTCSYVRAIKSTIQ
jgi:hypothetical protein